jgi:transcriptional regulator with XRE-family HTH domain
MTPGQLKDLRLSLGLNQTEMGARLGKCRAVINRYENGLKPIPDTVSMLAGTIRVPKSSN